MKLSAWLGIAAFVLVIVCAVITYNILAVQYSPDIELDFDTGQGGGEASALGAAEGEQPPALQATPFDPKGASKAPEGDSQKALDFALEDWDGNATSLYDLIAQGKPIVLNFWASWCPPCKGEMPEFEKVFKELGDDVQFIMLNVTDGQRETRAIGEKYVNDQGYTFPVFFDSSQEGSIVYGIRYIPTTLFIDSNGYIVAGAQSAIDEKILRQGIEMIK